MSRYSCLFVAFIAFTILVIVNATEKKEKVMINHGVEGMCRIDDKDGKCGQKSDEKEQESTPNEELKDDQEDIGSEDTDDETEEEEEEEKAEETQEEAIKKLKVKPSEEEMEEELKQEQTEEQEYLKGSACNYCTYCKFCKLCDLDCPCETSSRKPACDMCKYCKYCYLCKMGCDTICQPGGLVDRFTSYVSNHLPKYNKEEVDSDLQKAKKWIDNYRDEL